MPRPNEDVSPSHGISSSLSPSFSIPPHVLGRTLQNPTLDASGGGRRLQKPRPGVRVPCRNLTSQIVTHEEIAQEILQRSLKRNPASHSLVDSVKGRPLHFGPSGDSTFAKSLSQRLANQLSSSQTEVEEKNAKDAAGIVWSQSQAQPEIGEQNKLINSHGCYSIVEKQATEVVHGESNGTDVTIIPRAVPVSPRLNHHSTSKLDKVAEREIALKQLKELPTIKGGTPELTPELAAKRKLLVKTEICVQQAANKIGSPDLKESEKMGVSCGHALHDKTVVILHDCCSLDQGFVIKSTESADLSSLPCTLLDDCGKREMVDKLEKPREYTTRTLKLKHKQSTKSNLSNGHCTVLKEDTDLKRRSPRLSDKDMKNETAIKKKRGRPRKSEKMRHSFSVGSATMRGSLLGTNDSMKIVLSPKRPRLSDNSLMNRGACAHSLNLHASPSSPAVDIVKRSALKSPVLGNAGQISEKKRVSLIAIKGPQLNMQQRKKMKRYSTEVERLLNDEGARNMLLEANVLEEVIDLTLNEPSKENATASNEVQESPIKCEQKKSQKRQSFEMKKPSGDEEAAEKVLLKTNPVKGLTDVKVLKGTEERRGKSEAKQSSQTNSEPPKKKFLMKTDKPTNDNNARRALPENSPALEVNRLTESVKESNESESKPSAKTAAQQQKIARNRRILEVERLINDEGAMNMLLETSSLAAEVYSRRKCTRSHNKEMRRAARQNIIYKRSLVRKSILKTSSLASRPRRTLIYDKMREMERKKKFMEKKQKILGKRQELKQEVSGKEKEEGKSVREEKKQVVEDIENEVAVVENHGTNYSADPEESSLPFEISVHRVVLPMAAKASRIIRRHSSSSSFSSRSSSPNGTTSKSRRGSSSSISTKEVVCSANDAPGYMKTTVEIEHDNEVPLNANVDQGRQQCMIKCPNARKVVAVPRMSAAVRLKLNNEMSKNFQKGLNVESAKSISAKVSPKAKKSPISLQSPLKLNTVLDMKAHSSSPAPNCIKVQQSQFKDVKYLSTVKVAHQNGLPSTSTSAIRSPLSTQILKPDGVQGLDVLNGQELAVCVKKLQERKDVSITAIDDSGERTLEFPKPVQVNTCLAPKINTIRVPMVLPNQSTVGAMVDVVPKLKKLKNPKTSLLKNIIGKEHRIVGLPLSPIAGYNSVMKSLGNGTQKPKKKASTKLERRMDSKECFRQRSSGRQNAGTYNYKEICLRRYENFVQVILTPGSTKMKNSLNVQVLHEFRDALQQLRRDEFCRVVLVTSTGSTFCQGLDIHSLVHTNIERRKKAAVELSEALKDFLRVLAMFNKPIVAGVHGATVGLGVTMLPFFDVVYASDKATFHAPYARLGQIPEGAAVLTLPLMLGNAVTSELLFGSRKLTSSEALHYGLVTRVFWPDTFQEELIPNIKAMASQSSQSMQAMKALLRLNLRVKLEATLDSESSLLVQHWCSPECQRNFRKFLETSEELYFQKQKKDPC